MELFVYSIKIEGNALAALSLLPPHIVEQAGLPTEAVLGDVDPRRSEMTVEQFTPNEKFVQFLHQIIGRYAHTLPSVQTLAQKVHNGPVYVMDQRSLQKGLRPPFEDVIGWYGARNGELLPETYNGNPNYALLSSAGPITLEEPLEKALFEAILALPALTV